MALNSPICVDNLMCG